jgi:hypothetical protein
MIRDAIISAFRKKKERNWTKMYWAIDVHDTIFQGEYASNQKYDPSPEAIEVLKWLSDRNDMMIIIWTSSYSADYDRLRKWFSETHGVNFDFLNENPECGNTLYAKFDKKFYFNVLLDDKSGFCEADWKAIKETLIEIGEW